MLHLLLLSSFLIASWAACPNQCSGHGRCGANDKCICFKQQGLYTPYRYGFKGADCSQRTCPLGRAYDRISTVKASVQDLTFVSSTGYSHAHLTTVFLPSSMDERFKALRSDMNIVVQIMKVTSVLSVYSHTFAWKYDTDDYFQPEQTVGLFTSSAALFPITDPARGNTGVYLWFDPFKQGNLDFMTTAAEMAQGDQYTFRIAIDQSVDASAVLNLGDSNTLHQLLECSGRGQCDSAQGKCTCLPGYTGEACHRTVCPNQCSNHGSCQTEARFAVSGLAANGNYAGYEGAQQYGCKCDDGYRGADCSQVECPSGADVMGGDGGSQGMDCSGRGLCNYAIGVCSCFRGFFGARCEQQSTLV